MNHSPTSSHRGALLTLALAPTLAIWLFAYVTLSPIFNLPAGISGGWATIILILTGFFLAKQTGSGLTGGLKLGLLIGAINFILVASLHGKDRGEALTSGLLWIGGATVCSIVFCTLGAALGSLGKTPEKKSIIWSAPLALIVAAATFPLLISGGIVTGLEAGMAVPDWLTTFDYPMMFYPLTKMQADPGVYAEHFHRLWGLLVGLSVIILAVHLHRVETRKWIKRLSIFIILAIIIQGVLGGTRVTENSIILAGLHGVFAQMVFATIVLTAAFVSRTWRSDAPPVPHPSAPKDHRITTTLVILLLIQLMLGAMYRHTINPKFPVDIPKPVEHSILLLHVLMALVVAGYAARTAFRMVAHKTDHPLLKKIGMGLAHTILLQFLLGIGALVMVLVRGDQPEIPLLELILTTAHQINGALILTFATLLAAWTRRLLSPESP